MKFLIAVILILATGVSVESRGRIFGGSIANPKNFNYYALVEVQDSDGKFYRCGGSLISNFWVLSAAHCFDTGDISQTNVYLGLNELHQFTKGDNAIKVFPHEKFVLNSTHCINDIALIYMAYIEYNEYIHNIPLCNLADILNKYIIVPGYGMRGDQGFPTELQAATLKVVNDSICEAEYGATFIPSQFCTWDTNTNTCGGDSGGPAILIYNNVEQQVGLVSYGKFSNCTDDYPGSFTRVYSYLNWINETITNFEKIWV